MDHELRASDAERDDLVAALREHAALGRLTTDELEERTSVALAARTRGELAELRRDLPDPARAPAPVERAPVVAAPERFSAVLGTVEQNGRWLVPERFTARAILGDCRLDLRDADLPGEVTIKARVVLGEIRILVPEDARVQLTGRVVLGDRKIRGRPGAASAGGPLIRVVTNVVLGDVKVDVATTGERLRSLLR